MKCRDCGEEIYFLITGKGSKMPVNKSSMGEQEIEDCESGLKRLFIHERHISHFSNCPAAEKFRTKKKSPLDGSNKIGERKMKISCEENEMLDGLVVDTIKYQREDLTFFHWIDKQVADGIVLKRVDSYSIAVVEDTSYNWTHIVTYKVKLEKVEGDSPKEQKDWVLDL